MKFLFKKQLPEALENGCVFRETTFEMRNDRIEKRNVERNSVVVFNTLCLNAAMIFLLIAKARQVSDSAAIIRSFLARYLKNY